MKTFYFDDYKEFAKSFFEDDEETGYALFCGDGYEVSKIATELVRLGLDIFNMEMDTESDVPYFLTICEGEVNVEPVQNYLCEPEIAYISTSITNDKTLSKIALDNINGACIFEVSFEDVAKLKECTAELKDFPEIISLDETFDIAEKCFSCAERYECEEYRDAIMSEAVKILADYDEEDSCCECCDKCEELCSYCKPVVSKEESKSKELTKVKLDPKKTIGADEEGNVHSVSMSGGDGENEFWSRSYYSSEPIDEKTLDRLFSLWESI